jgi:protein gp37
MARNIEEGIYFDESWSPIIGCTHPGVGCPDCWAARMAQRFAGCNDLYKGLVRNGRWTGEWRLNQRHLADPLRWRRPRYVGCNWMGDLLHPGVPDTIILFVFSIMANADDHTFFFLTKFPERLARITQRMGWLMSLEPVRINDKPHLLTLHPYLDDKKPDGGVDLELRGLPGNVWAGTSISDSSEIQKAGMLSDVACKHRWISFEPLYGPMFRFGPAPYGEMFIAPDVDWVVVGGHNAPSPRPIPLDYCLWLRDKCAEHEIPFFFKQMHGRTKAERQNIPDDLRIRQMPDTTRRRRDGIKEAGF